MLDSSGKILIIYNGDVAMDKFSFSTTYEAILMALLSGILGAAIMLFDAYSTTESINFVRTNEFVIWFFINIATFALYPVLGVPLWKNVKLYRTQGYFRREIFLTSIIVIVLIAVPDTFARFFRQDIDVRSLAHLSVKIALLLGVGLFSVSLPVIITMWLIQIALQKEFAGNKFDKEHIDKFIGLRDDLSLMVRILGVSIGLLMLAAAALRKTLIVSGAISPDAYPIVSVSLYGAYFTLLILILYLPIYMSLNAVGNRICDTVASLPSPNSADWTKEYSKRKDFQELLQLNSLGLQNWQSGLAILIPLLSGVTSTLFT
jgi:hypothetical protein